MGLILILITVVISLVALSNTNWLNRLLFSPYAINHYKEYWRFISGGFIHSDYFHLAVNMISLFFFAAMDGGVVSNFVQLYGEIGAFLFLFMYLSAIPISSLYSYYKHKNNSQYAALGASGAVSAVIFSSILFNPTSKIVLYFAIGIPAWLFGILYLYYEYYMGKQQRDNIGHDAHFFGAIYGIVFTTIIHPTIFSDFFSKF